MFQSGSRAYCPGRDVCRSCCFASHGRLLCLRSTAFSRVRVICEARPSCLTRILFHDQCRGLDIGSVVPIDHPRPQVPFKGFASLMVAFGDCLRIWVHVLRARSNYLSKRSGKDDSSRRSLSYMCMTDKGLWGLWVPHFNLSI
jgi:hypothetical protein